MGHFRFMYDWILFKPVGVLPLVSLRAAWLIRGWEMSSVDWSRTGLQNSQYKINPFLKKHPTDFIGTASAYQSFIYQVDSLCLTVF